MRKKRVAIYARVSTDEQDPEMQLVELRAFCAARGYLVHREYVDRVSGNFAAKRRGILRRRGALAYDELMIDAETGKIDIVLVWKYDRFSRNLGVLMWALDKFSSWGVDFISYTQAIDTTTTAGKLFFQIIGSFAEFERETIVERVTAGMRKARARGVKFGPPCRITDETRERVHQLRAEGLSYRAIARDRGMSHTAVRSIVSGRAKDDEARRSLGG